jgi:hypothetical protein
VKLMPEKIAILNALKYKQLISSMPGGVVE